MSTSRFTVRKHDEEPSAGLDLSRLLVLGFLVAGLIGLLMGVGWVGWNLFKNFLAG